MNKTLRTTYIKDNVEHNKIILIISTLKILVNWWEKKSTQAIIQQLVQLFDCVFQPFHLIITINLLIVATTCDLL